MAKTVTRKTTDGNRSGATISPATISTFNNISAASTTSIAKNIK